MAVLYNGKSIIPAPMVSISKEYEKAGDGTNIGSKFTLVLTGKLLYNKGSPDKTKDFHTTSGYPADDTFTDPATERHTALLRKKEALRDLFIDEGEALEFVPWETPTPASMKCFPRVISMNFDDGSPETGGWHTFVNYTITLEADEILGIPGSEDAFLDANNTDVYIRDAQESWNIEFNEQAQGINNPYTFRLTHNINAVGKRSYNADGLISQAWEQARKWVYPRLGIDNAIVFSASGIPIDIGSYMGYNHIRTENIDEKAGSYGINETWLLSSGNVLEDFNVSIKTSTEAPVTSVSIDGSIVGLDTKTNGMVVTESRWTAANTKYNALVAANTLFSRAQTFSGLSTLNSTAVGTSVSKNPNNGTISYNYEYDTRPSNCVTGALSEKITITEQNPSDIFARIGVIGRTAGPILQSLGTVSERKFGVNIDVVMPAATGCPANANAVTAYLTQSPSTQVGNIITSFYNYLAAAHDQVFIESDSTNWSPKQGLYSRNVSWVYQDC